MRKNIEMRVSALGARLMNAVLQHRSFFVVLVLLPLSVIVNTLQWLFMQWRLLRADSSAHGKRVQRVSAAMMVLSLRRQNDDDTNTNNNNNNNNNNDNNNNNGNSSSGSDNDNSSLIVTARPGWANMSLKMGEMKQNKRKISLQHLVDIIGLDTAAQTVTVEPLVSIGQLTRFLLPRGYTLPVVPELDELTCGGLASGYGIESSSHIYGLFQDILVELEMVLADGRVVTATRDNEHKDLFFQIPWSHGTIAMLVGLTLRVLPCKKYITVRYRRYRTLKGICAAMERASCGCPNSNSSGSNSKNSSSGGAPANFVEGLQYGLNDAVIMEGRMTDDVPAGSTYNDISWHWKKWFYVHVDELTRGLESSDGNDENNNNNRNSHSNKAYYIEETVPLRAYYHRHTRSIFWEMPHIVPCASEPWFRALLGWTLPPNIPLLKCTQTDALRQMWKEEFVVQDYLVPLSQLEKTLLFSHERLGVYPLWLCPMLVMKPPSEDLGGFLKTSRFHREQVQKQQQKKKNGGCGSTAASAAAAAETAEVAADREMYVDVGLYGPPTQLPYDHMKVMREFEELLRDVDGGAGLYAINYSTRSEFREQFDHVNYDRVRRKYGAIGRFPEVFDKICDREIQKQLNSSSSSDSGKEQVKKSV